MGAPLYRAAAHLVQQVASYDDIEGCPRSERRRRAGAVRGQVAMILVLPRWRGAGPVQMPCPHAALQQTLLHPPFLTPMATGSTAQSQAKGSRQTEAAATHGLPITAGHAVCTLGLGTDCMRSRLDSCAAQREPQMHKTR